MEQYQLVRRLTVLRASVQRRLVVYGVCVVLTGCVTGFLLLVLLDWLLHLPSLLRSALALAFLAGWVTASVHWVFRPLHARLGIAQIASQLERHFKPLQDRLTSSVDFLEHGNAGSTSMMQQVVDGTEQIIRNVALESALTFGPLVRRGLLLLAASCALATLLWAAPSWARTGLFRYVHPWGGIEWPRRVAILPLTGNQIVAVGDSLTTRMRVQRGLNARLRAIVRLRERDGATYTLAMQRETDDTFYAGIDTVAEDLTYWFEAGDDTTARNPYTIRVVRRPEVVEALALIEPPAYAMDPSPRMHDLFDGAVRAPIGGHVRVRLRTNKPVASDPSRRGGRLVGLRTEAGELIPLDVDPSDQHGQAGPPVLTTRFRVDRDMQFRVELVDEHGFENRGAATHSIIAVPDAAPTVTIVEPKGPVDLTPQGSVPLVIRVQDDFGVEQLVLEFEQPGGKPHTMPLTDDLEVAEDGETVEGTARYLWNVATMALSPGDVLVYWAAATDNRVTDHETGQTAHSAPMQIKIISDVEFSIRLRSDIALIEARIRQVALDQASLLDRTAALRQSPEKHDPLDPAQRETAGDLAGRQARLVTRVRDLIRGGFDKLLEQLEHNRTADQEVRTHIVRLSEVLRQTADGPMTIASVELDEARERTRPDEQQAGLIEATRQQQVVIDRLRGVLRLMSQWGSFHELVTRARSLLDRQADLKSQTADLGKQTLGKPVDALTETEASTLRQNARQQDQLADEVEQLVEKMMRLMEKAEQEEPSDTDSVDAALRASRAHNVAKHARAASEAISSNRTAAATVEQKATATALRKMIAALRERESRQLEQLQKRLGQIEQLIAAMIEDQEALRNATHEATFIEADDAGYAVLEEEQRTLRRNTELLGDDLASAPAAAGTQRVSQLVRQAALPMETAETELRKRQPALATVAQDEALTTLNDALTLVRELAQETAQEALRRSLAQIREDLEEILALQTEVNAGIDSLVKGISHGGRISRVETRAASKLAHMQSDTRSMVDAQLPDYERVPVYKWALERVAKWMEISRTRLSSPGARQIDEDLLVVVNRIAVELRRLIRAIQETESLPLDMEFVETDTGGGQGQGELVTDRPVPTVAELLVLKALQTDINDRTQELQQSFDIDEATEQQLRELRVLGEDQAELRRLAERVTEQAQHP